MIPACDDCALGCGTPGGPAACDGGAGTPPAGAVSAEERRVMTASGIAIALLAAGLVLTGGDWPHLLLGGTAVVAGAAVSLSGRVALLPYATGALLLGLGARLLT